MFIETSFLAGNVLGNGHKAHIMKYDTIAVRVHESTSTKKGYYLKRRVSSPVMDWYYIGGKEITKDYVSFIQIKCNHTMTALFEEIFYFIRLRPINVLIPSFWFYALLTVFTPRPLLRKLPNIYRKYIGSKITKVIKKQ